MEKQGTMAAMADLILHPEYPYKHSLWDFTRGTQMKLSMGDLREIVGVLKLLSTREKGFANKSALLVPHMMGMGMAKIYVSLSKLLPFEYKIFTQINEAMDFLAPNQ
ncbi:MAG: hypothetical protein HUK40_02160 [Desulfobacter sp.]|nr:hypothetical protein [Desulfobacter sp.]